MPVLNESVSWLKRYLILMFANGSLYFVVCNTSAFSCMPHEGKIHDPQRRYMDTATDNSPI